MKSITHESPELSPMVPVGDMDGWERPDGEWFICRKWVTSNFNVPKNSRIVITVHNKRLQNTIRMMRTSEFYANRHMLLTPAEDWLDDIGIKVGQTFYVGIEICEATP